MEVQIYFSDMNEMDKTKALKNICSIFSALSRNIASHSDVKTTIYDLMLFLGSSLQPGRCLSGSTREYDKLPTLRALPSQVARMVGCLPPGGPGRTDHISNHKVQSG